LMPGVFSRILSKRLTKRETKKSEDTYPTNNTISTTVKNPNPGIFSGFPSGSSLTISGNAIRSKLGKMPSTKLKRDTTAQAVITIGARIINP